MSLAKWAQTISLAEAWTPEEVKAQKINNIPPEMVEAVNELLAKHWTGSGATLKPRDIEALARKKMADAGTNLARKDFYDEGWMDFEPIYEAKGWKVFYDRPGYNETYEATYAFTRKDR